MLYLSILGYEEELMRYSRVMDSPLIRLIIDLLDHVDGLHFDIIRPPFSSRPRFSSVTINQLVSMIEDMPYDVHIVSSDPISIFNDLNLEGTPEVSLQVEAFNNRLNVLESMDKIRERGFLAGICINLPSPIRGVSKEILNAADLILVMAVPVGKGGQKFSLAALEKLRKLKQLYPSKILEVDGGVNEVTGRLCIRAGADRLVVGSRITGKKDPVEAVNIIRKEIMG